MNDVFSRPSYFQFGNAFSSNFPNNLPPASPDYVPASPGKTYSSASNLILIDPQAAQPYQVIHDDPYMKVLQAFYNDKSPIPPPIIIPPKPNNSFFRKDFFHQRNQVDNLLLPPSQPQSLR
ncbi:hypothetical protein Tco_0521778 [Tanacetum coccineum]